MSERREKPALEPPSAAPAGFRSLLIPTDMSPLSDRVLRRAALLPLARAAQLTLLHVVSTSLPVYAQRTARQKAQRALAEDATALRAKLPKSATIKAIVKVGFPAAEIAACAASMRPEMIVMGRGGGRTMRDIFLGATAERVIRRGQRPVLAVRLRPHGVYRRPALALDIDEAAQGAVAMLLRLIPPPRGRVTVIHAYDLLQYGLRQAGLTEDAVAHLRDQYQQEGMREIASVLGTALARAKVARRDAPAWIMHVRYGSPRSIIKTVVKKADNDLLVMGTRGRTGLAQVFLGSVAGDVLRDVACDTLIVPPRRGRSR